MESTKRERAVCHVIQGRRIVARQREVVSRLTREGIDTTEAEHTRDLFICTLKTFEDGLKRILTDESAGASK
jgi:arginine repressor